MTDNSQGLDLLVVKNVIRCAKAYETAIQQYLDAQNKFCDVLSELQELSKNNSFLMEILTKINDVRGLINEC